MKKFIKIVIVISIIAIAIGIFFIPEAKNLQEALGIGVPMIVIIINLINIHFMRKLHKKREAD